MKKRVGIIGLLQESNTFIRAKTTLGHFEQDVLAAGPQVRERFAGASHEIGGFFDGLEAEGIEAVPIFAARAIPYGPIEASVLDELVDRMLAALDDALPLDGILAAPHGATVSEGIRDVDGHWLQRIRDRVGDRTPIIATIDAHANLSQAMVDATDALIAYRTNPHLDQHERGLEASRLMAASMTSGTRPSQSARLLPLAINIQNQNTGKPPLKPIYELAEQMRGESDVTSLSIVLGFPYADVSEMGSALVVVTEESVPPARREALLDELASQMEQAKDQWEPEFIDAATAVSQLKAGTNCLLDMGDNVGGGSPGDSTILAAELHRQQIGPAFVCLADPDAIARLAGVEIGQHADVKVGGKTDQMHGEPMETTVRVVSRHDGRFHESETRHGGFSTFDQGDTTVVETTESQLTIMLTQKRMPPFSLAQLTTFGIDPMSFHAIVAKGVIAPMAAYEPVVDHFVHVNTPGVTCADMRQLPYRHRRKPMFPFE